MTRRALLALTFAALGFSRSDGAWACHVEYVLRQNDTLEAIARQIYNDPAKWQVIYYANQDRLVEGTSLLRPGTSIRLPCAAGNAPLPPAPAAGSPAAHEKTITGSLDRKEPPGIIIPFHLTSAEGVGRKIGFLLARNSRISVGSREEIALILSPSLEGLPPGPHAFHVHANADCGPGEENGKIVPGLAAGPHLFVKGTGGEAGITYHSHLGDLPDLLVAEDGTAKQEIAAPRLTLHDVRGRSLIIHSTQDDASDRQACGVVPCGATGAAVGDCLYRTRRRSSTGAFPIVPTMSAVCAANVSSQTRTSGASLLRLSIPTRQFLAPTL